MAFVAGMMLIEAPASALNNAGAEEGARTDNTIAVKRIRGRAGGDYPYVSAQAVRYWLRTYLSARFQNGRRLRYSAKLRSRTPMRTLYVGGTTICSATCARRPSALVHATRTREGIRHP